VGDISAPEVTMPDSSGSSPRARKFRGVVHIDWDRCKGCGFCIEFCPPKVLAFSEDYNSHGYHPPYLINAEGCTGCDLCGLYCPDFAIFGTRVPVETHEAEVGAREG
jgi:2-oxoglutarate ferredoxin oxidoreductase subunit delta